jgi:hypothetical protein
MIYYSTSVSDHQNQPFQEFAQTDLLLPSATSSELYEHLPLCPLRFIKNIRSTVSTDLYTSTDTDLQLTHLFYRVLVVRVKMISFSNSVINELGLTVVSTSWMNLHSDFSPPYFYPTSHRHVLASDNVFGILF